MRPSPFPLPSLLSRSRRSPSFHLVFFFYRFYIATDERNATFVAHMRDEGAVFIDDLLTFEDRRQVTFSTFPLFDASFNVVFAYILRLQGVRCLGAALWRRDGNSRAELALSLLLHLRSCSQFSVSYFSSLFSTSTTSLDCRRADLTLRLDSSVRRESFINERDMERTQGRPCWIRIFCCRVRIHCILSS